MSDFYSLTPYEFSKIAMHYEESKKRDLELLRNAHLNAIMNSNRKKGQKFIDLFNKKKQKTTASLSKEEIMKQRQLIFGGD